MTDDLFSVAEATARRDAGIDSAEDHMDPEWHRLMLWTIRSIVPGTELLIEDVSPASRHVARDSRPPGRGSDRPRGVETRAHRVGGLRRGEHVEPEPEDALDPDRSTGDVTPERGPATVVDVERSRTEDGESDPGPAEGTPEPEAQVTGSRTRAQIDAERQGLDARILALHRAGASYRDVVAALARTGTEITIARAHRGSPAGDRRRAGQRRRSDPVERCSRRSTTPIASSARSLTP